MWACHSLLADLSPQCLISTINEYTITINTSIYWFILIKITWLHVLTKTSLSAGQYITQTMKFATAISFYS
jgi:hypothetical protein